MRNQRNAGTNEWPRYVRWVAVAYVLSRFIGPLGFFVLAAVGGFQIARHGPNWESGAGITMMAALARARFCAQFSEAGFEVGVESTGPLTNHTKTTYQTERRSSFAQQCRGAIVNSNSTRSIDRSAVDLALLVVRLIGGTIIAVHGAQKLFGAFGGKGLADFVQQQGNIGYLVAIGECFGGIGIALGFLSRFSALANIVIMCGAIQMVHGKNGFFLSAGGYEYNLALIGLFAPILIAGPGRWSVAHCVRLPKLIE